MTGGSATADRTQAALGATSEALDLIERLKADFGPLALVQLGGFDDEGRTLCLTRGEVLESETDLKLGAIAGTPFLLDSGQYRTCGSPALTLDVEPGSGGFSLEGREGVRFVVRVGTD